MEEAVTAVDILTWVLIALFGCLVTFAALALVIPCVLVGIVVRHELRDRRRAHPDARRGAP